MSRVVLPLVTRLFSKNKVNLIKKKYRQHMSNHVAVKIFIKTQKKVLRKQCFMMLIQRGALREKTNLFHCLESTKNKTQSQLDFK